MVGFFRHPTNDNTPTPEWLELEEEHGIFEAAHLLKLRPHSKHLSNLRSFVRFEIAMRETETEERRKALRVVE